MDNKIKETLEDDYKFVLISGDYFDCPSCNNSTSFNANTFYDEKALLEYMVANTNVERMERIYLLGSYSGELVKYCEIETSTGRHNVAKLEFELPQTGKVIIHKENGVYKIADKGYTALYGKPGT